MVRYLKSRADAAATTTSNTDVPTTVKNVIDDIRLNGDKAVRKYSETFDRWSPSSFKLSQADIDKAIAAVPEQTIKDIKEVQDNVRTFAIAQRKSVNDFELEIRPGVHLGQRHIPISSVGAYVHLSLSFIEDYIGLHPIL